jgi:hypothetical protein
MSYQATGAVGLGMIGFGLFASAPLEAGSVPVLALGSMGPDVKRWQRFVGVVDDGVFGPDTKIATKSFQTYAHLTADGVVGPATWAAAMAESAALLVSSGQQPVPGPVETCPAGTVWNETGTQCVARPGAPVAQASVVAGGAASGNWWKLQTTPTKVAIVGGSVAVLAALAYVVSSRSRPTRANRRR